MKNKPKNIPSPYKFSGTKIFRDTTALPFADGGLMDNNLKNNTPSCPPFHIYDSATGQCVPMSEEQKAQHSLQFMQGWSNSPMHNEMLKTSIQKDKPGEDINTYFNNVAGLRNRATNTNINIIPADSSGVYGYADPIYLSNLQGGKENTIYSTNLNTPINFQWYKTQLTDKTLDPESKKEYTDLIKRNSNTNNLIGNSTFYTKNRPGEHSYVYPHEFSHLQDIGGNLIPFSDKNLIKSYRDQEFLKGQQDINIPDGRVSDISEKELYPKLYAFAKSYYPKSRRYEADKKMYEENFEKFKKQNPKLNFNTTKDNSMPYNDFIDKNSTDAHWSKFLSNEDYIGTHTETRARLNAARMYGKEYGIYDPYTEKLTPEKYKQLLDIFEKQNPDTKDANQLRQLKEVFTDEQIINMMNTISKNNNKNSLDITSQPNEINLFADGGPLHDRNINGKLLNSTYASQLGNMFREGGPFGENKGMFDYATSIYASQPGNYYANGGQIQSQSCNPGYYWNGKECVKSFVPVAKQKPKPVIKNKKEQELIDYGKKTLPSKKVASKPIDNIPFYGDISNATQPDDLTENIVEVADQTGYFSWDDAYRAKAAWDKSGSEYPTTNQALDMFGAVPGLGKLGKLKYLKNASAIKNSMKYIAPAFGVIPWQGILNAFDTGQDINQDNINYATGGMIKRADGSYSQRGLWDNIRANKGSGKKPTKEMLAQERKINREYRTGGQFPTPYSLPEDSFKQGGRNLHNSVYASSLAQYPAIYANGGKINVVAGGEKHRVYIKESPTGVGEGVQGHVMVNHPTMDKGQWDTIDLTTKAGAKTVAEGIAATKKWHKENPNTYKNGGGMSSHFYASNVPDNNISNKDLTYPENSYVYAQGGNLNNLPMNRYPAASRFLEEGSTASPLTNMMSIPAKTFAYERGGKIYIKPENKGKFTASANRAGMGVQEFASHVLANKNDYSSTQVKRANFAHNAAGWKHATGGHMMAAGGWPPGLKLSNQTLSFLPYYSNAITGLYSPSAEMQFDAGIGKQKGQRQLGWSMSPHLGIGYNPNGKLPISGGLDLRYKGLASPDKKGNAFIDLGAGYTPEQGLGTGGRGGYTYRFGPNRRGDELKAGTAALEVSPYAGWQLFQDPEYKQGEPGSSTGPLQEKYGLGNNPVYGLNLEGEWRPRLFKNADVQQAPLTFFGSADLNVNPIKGKINEKNKDSNVKVEPQSFIKAGVRMPLDRFSNYFRRERIPAQEGGEYYNYDEPIEPSIEEEEDKTGNWVQNEKGEDVWQYNPGFGDSPNASTIAGEEVVVPTTKFNKSNRKQNPIIYDFNTKEFTTPPIPEIEPNYKYGGTMNFKYGGFNNPGFNALPKDVQAKIKSRTFASGGVMPQLTEFNEGGTHEENSLGGIPQGTAGDGRLNLVEEGETKLNAANYIFSDTLKLDKGIAAAFNLPKGDVGKTFSDISKRLNRPNSRRDNDNIEQNAVQRDLENLMLAQEAFKQVDLQKDIEMMKTKHPEFMEAMDATMQQQSAQQQQPSPEEMQQMQQMQQGAPQPGSPEEQAMMEEQMMQEQMMAQQQGQGGMPSQGMSPEEMAQIPMSYGGAMFMRGGKMCYANGGHMYGKGGQVLRSIGAGAYGVGEGLLDTLTFGLTDQITDKGYDALAGIGNRDEDDLERDKMIRGFGNTAGAIGGAVVSGGAATGSAISEGFEGLDAGLTGIKGTNKAFDDTVHSLAKIGSIAGSFVGGGAPGGGAGALGGLGGAGGAAGAAGAANAAQGATQASQVPQFAETLMKAGQNPFLQQVTGMAGSMMQRNGGYMYPTMYKYGGSFEMPRQQMYMPLDNVERMGGYMFAGGGLMDPPDDIPLLSDVPRLNINGRLYTKAEALAAVGKGEFFANPSEVEEYFADDILMPQGANTTSLPVNDNNNIDEIDTDETNVLTQDEEDLANITYPGASSPNIITGGKGDYTDMDTLNEEIISAENMVYNSKNSTDKEKAQNYLSALKRLKTDLENRNVDLTMKQTPMQAAGMAAPIAYNLGMGLFSKPTQLKAEDYLNKSRVTPYKVNVDPQLNEARLAYNAAEQGIRNAAPSAGAYLTNRANIAKMRTGSLGEILAKKENTDAQLQMQADAQNAQLEAQNRGTKFAVDDWNAKSKEAKRKYLEKSIEQMGTLAQNAQAMDVQEKYMRLLSPQYGKTFEYQTIFDQLKDYYKNMKSSKENKV